MTHHGVAAAGGAKRPTTPVPRATSPLRSRYRGSLAHGPRYRERTGDVARGTGVAGRFAPPAAATL
jgi:hypothetical protein